MAVVKDSRYYAFLIYFIGWKRQRQAEGYCLICGAMRGNSSSARLCRECLEKERARLRVSAQELRERRIKAGLCVTCGQNPRDVESTTRCRSCVERDTFLRRTRGQGWYARRPQGVSQ